MFMTNDRKDEAPAAAAEEFPKRPPPTIDLEASEVSGDTQRDANERLSAMGSGTREGLLGRLIAPLSGAIAALLVLAAAWGAGLIGPPPPAQVSVSPAQLDGVKANVGDVTARLARVEAAAARPAAPAVDPALARRTETLETSLAAAREEVARLNVQLRTVTASLSELRAMPRDGSAPASDLAPLSERLARLEEATKAFSTELAKPAPASADDINVRRLVVANTLDAAVRRGEPFAAALAAAKQVAASPAALAPLEAFADKGIPSDTTYLRDVVPILQRIAAAPSKPAAGAAEKSGGVLDQLQSGLTRLVRVERDTGPSAKESAAAPATATAIRRDDLATARQDVAKLPQASDPQIQAWIKSVDAREAALSAAQKFSAEALAVFGKSGQ
jgi:hypothetical protein